MVISLVACKSNISDKLVEDAVAQNPEVTIAGEEESSEDSGGVNLETASDFAETEEVASNEGTKEDDVTDESGNTEPTEESNETSSNQTNEDKTLSRELNTKGYELYKDKDYESALDYFKKAYEADDTYLYAHYNYACTLGVLMKMDYPQWYDYRSDIHDHLKIVLNIDPNYIEKIKTDEDLDLIRKDFEYHKLLGYGTEKDEDIKYMLVELDWYVNGPGVFTPIGSAGFKKDGSFVFSFADLAMFSEGDFPVDTDYFEGTYVVEEGIIRFTLNKKMLRRREYADFFEREINEDLLEFEGRMDEDGTLYIEIFDYPIHNWMDEFSA